MSTFAEPGREITVVIDGREVAAAHREPLIRVARRAGISVPTLCHHDALEPAAVCRLCLVEELREGQSRLVTACNFPVEDGMAFRTDSEAVLRNRRLAAEALLARCPSVPAVREIAAKLGVGEPRLPPGDETCILCDLCVRVCSAYATSAIAAVSRGGDRRIGTFGDAPPEDCVGCGACAEICPTGHIATERSTGALRIWDREFPLAVCTVDRERCLGCGACEEACPFSVPRVSLRRGEVPAASIDPEACRGCGVCLSACPAGAISQPRARRALPEPQPDGPGGGLLVIACERCGLGRPTAPPLPERARLRELPCTGGASPALLLGALARGFDGVCVLGRHEETCRLRGAEDRPRRVADRVDRLAALVGLGRGRVAFVEPPPGREGPALAAAEFLAGLSPTPLASGREETADTLDGALESLAWLCAREELSIDGSEWLSERGLPPARPGEPALLANAIPYLDLLAGDLIRPADLGDVLARALEALRGAGVKAGVLVNGFLGGDEEMIAKLGAPELYGLCSGCTERAAGLGANAIALGDLLRERAAVIESIDVGPGPEVGLPVAISRAERAAVEGRLDRAREAGADALLAAGPAELFHYLLATREGSWRSTRVRPVLASDLFAAGREGRPAR